MASEWPVVPLGEVLNLKRGNDLAARDRRLGKVPIVSSSGVSGLHSSPMVQAPGVVTGRYGTIGLVHYVEEPFWPLNTTLYVENFKGNDPLFIYYLLKTISYRDYLDKAAVPGINRNDVHRAQVRLPPLEEQKRIASTLTALDGRIALLQMSSTTLESLVRTIFNSWFVDFDPVRAKAEGREPEGMDAATAALFPDTFGSDGAPKGWSYQPLGTLMEQSRQSINPLRHPDRLFYHYSLPTFDEGRMPKVEAGRNIKSNKTIVADGALLVSKLNPHIPRIWLPEVQSGLTSVCSTEFLSFLPVHPLSSEYLFCQFSEDEFARSMTSLTTGTSNSHQRVNFDALMAKQIIRSADCVAETFNVLARALLNKVKANNREQQTLVELRGTLLPRLISGKIRVPEAEKIVGAAL